MERAKDRCRRWSTDGAGDSVRHLNGVKDEDI